MPLLPLRLSRRDQSIDVVGLLDTGATINVVPYSIGTSLGAVWDEDATPIHLSGSLGSIEARAIVVIAHIEQLPPVRLALAWAQSDNTRFLLGQRNFFQTFNVCLYRTERYFEVTLP